MIWLLITDVHGAHQPDHCNRLATGGLLQACTAPTNLIELGSKHVIKLSDNMRCIRVLKRMTKWLAW